MIEALWPTLRLLCLALLLGRVLLSFLPPGEPGGHSLRRLPVTLAASLVLGAGLLLALSFVANEPWALALGLGTAGWLLRWATSPGGIVPRHGLPEERAGWLARLLFVGALVPAILAWPSAGEYLEDLPDLYFMEIAHRLALVLLVVFVEHGLATARRAPLGRRLFVLALSLLLFRENPNPASSSQLIERISAAGYVAGAAFALGWLRRADRRSALLAIACFVLGRPWDSFEGVVLVAAALLALVLCTPLPSRAWIAKASAVGLVLSVAPALRGMQWIGPLPSYSAFVEYLGLALVVLVLATAAWIARSIAARRVAEPAESREALARGDVLLLLLVLAAGAVGSQLGASGLQLVAPVAILLAGCVSIRPERAA